MADQNQTPGLAPERELAPISLESILRGSSLPEDSAASPDTPKSPSEPQIPEHISKAAFDLSTLDKSAQPFSTNEQVFSAGEDTTLRNAINTVTLGAQTIWERAVARKASAAEELPMRRRQRVAAFLIMGAVGISPLLPAAIGPGNNDKTSHQRSDVRAEKRVEAAQDKSLKIRKLAPALSGPGGSIDPQGITLHWWGQRFGKGIDPLYRTFKRNGLSVQVGITEQGDVYKMTDSLTTRTYHAIGANDHTIGIEIEGGPADFGEEGVKKNPEKFEAVSKTVDYLTKKYNIPLQGKPYCNNPTGVHPHSAYNACKGAVKKSDIDPKYFKAVMKRVREIRE